MSEVIRVNTLDELECVMGRGYNATIMDVEIKFDMNKTKRIELLEGCPYVELSGSLYDDLKKEQESKSFVSIYGKQVRHYYNELEVFEYLVKKGRLLCSVNDGPYLDADKMFKYSGELLSLLGIAESIKETYLRGQYFYEWSRIGNKTYYFKDEFTPVLTSKDLYDSNKHRNKALRSLKKSTTPYLRFSVDGSDLYCTTPKEVIEYISKD